MSTSWIVTIIVIVFLILFAVLGFRKGFFKIILSTMTLVVAFVVAGFILPWFSGVIETSFIGKAVDKKIGSYIEENVDETIANSVSEVQDAVIEGLPLPSFMRQDISEKNTNEDYFRFHVINFTEYIRTRLAKIVDNIIAYLILSVVIFVLLRLLMKLSGAINKIPVVGGLNRFFGGIFGLAEGLLILWVLCLVLMLFSGTPFGMKAIEVIEDNAFLQFIFEKNGIVMGINLVTQALVKS